MSDEMPAWLKIDRASRSIVYDLPLLYIWATDEVTGAGVNRMSIPPLDHWSRAFMTRVDRGPHGRAIYSASDEAVRARYAAIDVMNEACAAASPDDYCGGTAVAAWFRCALVMREYGEHDRARLALRRAKLAVRRARWERWSTLAMRP